MTKRKSKSTKSTASPTLIVLGFDDQQKPRGARFVDAKPDLVTKAADLLGFKVFQATPPEVAEIAGKLPLGRLYANGRGFVPNIRQSLYSDLVVVLGQEPDAALSRNGNGLPVALGLPRSWDELAPGHLVIAQEALEYGWWEAIVLDRQGDTFTLQYRDYPHLPKFVRHRSGIAMMSPPTDEAKPAAQVQQA
jgi:hypothetical protein